MNVGSPETGAPTVEATGPRAEARAAQREQFLSKLQPGAGELLEMRFPTDKLMRYPKLPLNHRNMKANELDSYRDTWSVDDILDLGDLYTLDHFKEFSGHGYTLLANLAATAQNPTELRNTFRGLSALGNELMQVHPTKSKFFVDQNSPVRVAVPGVIPERLTEGARNIVTKLLKGYDGELSQTGAIARRLSGSRDPKLRPYMAEVVTYLLSSGELSNADIKQLLMSMHIMDFMTGDLAQKEAFGPNASYWKDIDQSGATGSGEVGGNEADPLEVRLLEGQIRHLKAEQRKWLGEKGALEGRALKAEGRVGELQTERDQLAKELAEAKLANARLRQSGATEAEPKADDIFGRFLYGNFRTKKDLRDMPKTERRKEIERLKGIAGRSLHSDLGAQKRLGGIDPLSVINSELDKLADY